MFVLRSHYAKAFPPSGQKDVATLDICSSWISHYPKDYTAGRISGAKFQMCSSSNVHRPVLEDIICCDSLPP